MKSRVRGAAVPGTAPERWDWLYRGFSRYALRMLRRNFDVLQVLDGVGETVGAHEPLLVFSNHPSWWDPLAGVAVVRGCFPDRTPYAAIDSAALEKYGVFKRLGFFGVEPGRAAGARALLRVAETVFAQPRSLLWLTAQGEFQDVRERPVVLKPGVAAVAARCPEAVCVPLAFEYVFGPERLPEIWVWLGEPLRGERRGLTDCARSLEAVQDRLAERVKSRDSTGFRVLVRGGSGAGGIYDLCRRAACWLRGRPFDPRHLPESP
jgi:hypothetical protein